MFIIVKVEPLDPATDFTHLGLTVAYNNSNWASLYQNIRKARRWWGIVAKVATKSTGADAGDVLQGSNLYGAAIWEQDMGGDGVHVEINGRVTSSVNQKDCSYDG